jgi:hypothetical protein
VHSQCEGGRGTGIEPSPGEARAESLEVQCRAAARAELKGPDCRMWMPPNPTSHCNIPTQTEVHIYDNKRLSASSDTVRDDNQKPDHDGGTEVAKLRRPAAFPPSGPRRA